MLKLGLDIHGVISQDPHIFSEMAREWIAAGNEVHIITGITQSDEVVKQLREEYGMVWTHFYSIVDTLLEQGVEPLPHSTHNRPYFPDEHWDPAKAEYCAENGITVHYDDTEHYGDYFSTKFVYYPRRK
jgi:hypothetical protein